MMVADKFYRSPYVPLSELASPDYSPVMPAPLPPQNIYSPQRDYFNAPEPQEIYPPSTLLAVIRRQKEVVFT